MTPATEKRLLQVVVLLVLLVPLSGSIEGIAKGPPWLDHGAHGRDLDSHFRYLSGLLLAMTLLFASCVPAIERKGARMRMLAVLPIIGGLSRLLSLVVIGPPRTTHTVALCIELGVVPLLVLWQARVARRFT